MKPAAVTHEAVLAPHVRRTLRLVRQQQGVVLILHDGTELDYSGLKSLHPQLGQIGNSFGKGYECLNSLAVLLKGRTVLGLVSQILHVRPRVENAHREAQSRPIIHELIHPFYGLSTRKLRSIVHYPRTAFDLGQRTPSWQRGSTARTGADFGKTTIARRSCL